MALPTAAPTTTDNDIHQELDVTLHESLCEPAAKPPMTTAAIQPTCGGLSWLDLLKRRIPRPGTAAALTRIHPLAQLDRSPRAEEICL